VKVSADAEHLTLEVGDDGQGLPAAPPSGERARAGSGLEGIRERVRLLNGELLLQRPEGGGLLLRAVVPLLSESPQTGEDDDAAPAGQEPRR
jgi:signal transduction histidine kinase